jgi:hypothetical protein
MARERCTSLCTKPTTGTCKLCDALDERDAFVWWLFMPERWLKHLGRDIAADGGYRIVIGIVATLVGAYFGLYAIVEARHERHLNRALFERSAFMTMVVTGPSGFRSAMDQFAQIQNQTAPIEPDLSLPPWKWFGEYTPNRESLRQWALNFMTQCEPKTCGTLAEKDETGKVKEGSKSWRINLPKANLGGADLLGAYLRDADLRGARNLAQGQIEAACVYKSTTLPADIKSPEKNPKDCPPESLFQQQ